MYKKNVPYRKFDGKPGNEVLYFNLTFGEVAENLEHFETLRSWGRNIESGGITSTEQMVEIYRALRDLTIAAWGEPSEDGRFFRKAGRYDFAESAMFTALFESFLADPNSMMEFLNKVMPATADIEALAKKTGEAVDKSLENPDLDPERAERIRALRAELSSLEP